MLLNFVNQKIRKHSIFNFKSTLRLRYFESLNTKCSNCNVSERVNVNSNLASVVYCHEYTARYATSEKKKKSFRHATARQRQMREDGYVYACRAYTKTDRVMKWATAKRMLSNVTKTCALERTNVDEYQ